MVIEWINKQTGELSHLSILSSYSSENLWYLFIFNDDILMVSSWSVWSGPTKQGETAVWPEHMTFPIHANFEEPFSQILINFSLNLLLLLIMLNHVKLPGIFSL